MTDNCPPGREYRLYLRGTVFAFMVDWNYEINYYIIRDEAVTRSRDSPGRDFHRRYEEEKQYE